MPKGIPAQPKSARAPKSNPGEAVAAPSRRAKIAAAVAAAPARRKAAAPAPVPAPVVGIRVKKPPMSEEQKRAFNAARVRYTRAGMLGPDASAKALADVMGSSSAPAAAPAAAPKRAAVRAPKSAPTVEAAPVARRGRRVAATTDTAPEAIVVGADSLADIAASDKPMLIISATWLGGSKPVSATVYAQSLKDAQKQLALAFPS